MSLAYLNGKLIDKNEITISIDDFGFCRGNSVFELTRIYGEKPFHLDEHLNRLIRSLEICNIKQQYSKNDFKRMSLDLIEKNNYDDSIVKIYITQGKAKAAKRSLSVGDDYEANVMIINTPVTPLSGNYPGDKYPYIEGVSMATYATERALPEAKTTNYINAIAAVSAVEKQGFADIIYTNSNDEVSEASRSNLFFVKGGALITPDSGMLLGVTRGVILNIAKELGIETQVRIVKVNEIATMDEAFVTGSLSELVPINKINDKHFDVNSYEVYKKIWHTFKSKVAECYSTTTENLNVDTSILANKHHVPNLGKKS